MSKNVPRGSMQRILRLLARAFRFSPPARLPDGTSGAVPPQVPDNLSKASRTLRRGAGLKAVCLITLAAIPAAIAYTAVRNGALQDLSAIQGAAYPQKAEALVANGFPLGNRLAALGRGIKIFGGQREAAGGKNRIFVSQSGLMKNIRPPVEARVGSNVAGIAAFAAFARTYQKPVYIALIPTSAAVMQQNLPRFAKDTIVNQRAFIEDVYGKLSNGASSIDVYSALSEQRGRYIYYRTEDLLTSLGGYYVYSAILSRLGIGKASLQAFDIEYVNNYFYGSLYAESGYRRVAPDTIALYRYGMSNSEPHEYLVLHKGKPEKMYHTLFPAHAAAAGDELSVFLGGLSAVTDIRCSSRSATEILLFGDQTAISYLPFLANNCKRVTFVDLSRGGSESREISLELYDQVIFAYGVETFMHTNTPAKAAAFVEE